MLDNCLAPRRLTFRTMFVSCTCCSRDQNGSDPYLLLKQSSPARSLSGQTLRLATCSWGTRTSIYIFEQLFQTMTRTQCHNKRDQVPPQPLPGRLLDTRSLHARDVLKARLVANLIRLLLPSMEITANMPTCQGENENCVRLYLLRKLAKPCLSCAHPNISFS